MNNKYMKRSILAVISLLCALSCTAFGGDYSLQQYMNIQNALHPSFSPNGAEIMYSTNLSGEPQIWRIGSQGSFQSQCTFDSNGVCDGWWSPRYMDEVVVDARLGENRNSQLYLVSPYGGAWKRITQNYEAIYVFGGYSPDGTNFAFASNERNKKDFDIYEYDIATSKTTKLFDGQGKNQPTGYSRDGRYLMVQKTHSTINSDLYVYDRQSKSTKLITKHEGNVIFKNPVWDADSTSFYFLTDQGREYLGLAHWKMDSSTYRWVETPEADIEQIVVSNDGIMLAWTENVQGCSQFHFRNIKRHIDIGAYRTPKGSIRDMSFCQDGTKLVFSFSSPARPYDLWVYDTKEDKLYQITQNATGGIPLKEFRDPEFVEYPSFDKKSISALWYSPTSLKEKMPAVVLLNGDPETNYRYEMDGFVQYLIHNGYAVLIPDIRGTAGHGKSNKSLDDVRKRTDAISDVEYAAQWLATQKGIDSKKISILGKGYGGYLALSALTNSPDRWAAGISISGVSNLAAFLEQSNPSCKEILEAEFGNPVADRDFLTQISPLTHADKVKSPLLLIHGSDDSQVSKEESLQMANAVRKVGGKAECILIEHEGHKIAKRINQIRVSQSIVDFLNQNLNKK